jgi:hypothetical protein
VILAVIVACEIGFWVFLLAGLAARYLLRWKTVSSVLLVCVLLVDLALLAATIVDLRGGAVADAAHGLAAAYIGFSVAFSHSVIRWADAQFAFRFAGGPQPAKPPRHGWARARHEWREFGKAVVAWAVSCLLLVGGIALVGATERTEALQGWIWRLTLVLAIWLIWPVWETIASLKPTQNREAIRTRREAPPAPQLPRPDQHQRDGSRP